MVIIIKITPYHVNSKKLKRSMPRSTATALTIRLVEVPISVQLPPIIPAKEMGKSNFEPGISYLADNSVIILIKTITTAVVLIKAEILPAINIKTGTIIKMGSILKFLRPLANQSITPFVSSPIAIIIKARTVIVAGLEKPEIASSGLTRFVSNRAARIKKAILSTGNTSRTNRIITTIIMKNNIAISRLII